MLADFVNGVVPELVKLQNSGNPFNWNMYAIPNFKEHLGKTRYVDVHLLMISKLSKHQEEAFQVASFISASPEVQALVSQNGKVTPLHNDQIKKEFGKQVEALKGKNIGAILKAVPAEMPDPSPYDDIIKTELRGAAEKIGKNTTDINTVLRETDNAAEKNIAAEKNK